MDIIKTKVKDRLGKYYNVQSDSKGLEVNGPLEDYTETDIGKFVAGLDGTLAKYQTNFLDNHIDGHLIATSSDADLEEIFQEIGLSSKLHRRRFISEFKKVEKRLKKPGETLGEKKQTDQDVAIQGKALEEKIAIREKALIEREKDIALREKEAYEKMTKVAVEKEILDYQNNFSKYETNIPALVKVLTYEQSNYKTKAARAFKDLAVGNADNKKTIAAKGGIEPLIELLKSGTADGKGWAAGTLLNLSSNNDDIKKTIAAKGLAIIKSALQNETNSDTKSKIQDLFNKIT